MRVEDVQLQERARDVLAKALPNHVVALTLSPRTPGWLKAIGLEPMLLGLDLRGGVHFLYQVDLDTAVGQFLETYETDLRTQFREREIRNDIRVDGTTLQVAIIEPADMDRAEDDHPRARLRRSAPAARPAHEPAHHRPRAGRRPSRFQRAAHGVRDPRAPGLRDPAEHA